MNYGGLIHLQIKIEDTKVDEVKNIEDNAREEQVEKIRGASVDHLIHGCLVKSLRSAVLKEHHLDLKEFTNTLF